MVLMTSSARQGGLIFLLGEKMKVDKGQTTQRYVLTVQFILLSLFRFLLSSLLPRNIEAGGLCQIMTVMTTDRGAGVS